jgi:uncharacterized membrane protein
MKNPTFSIKLTATDWIIEIATLGLLITCITYASINYSSLPVNIPTHFGFSGHPDGFGNKSNLLFLMGVSIFIYLLVLFCNKYPALINYPFEFTPQNEKLHFKNAFLMIRFLKLALVVMFSEIIYATIKTAQGFQQGLDAFMVPLLLVMIIGLVAFFLTRGYLISKK